MYVVLAIGLNDFLLKDIQFNFILSLIQFANGHLKAPGMKLIQSEAYKLTLALPQLKNNPLHQ